MTVSTVFLLLVLYSIGVAWAAFLPKRSWVEGTRLQSLTPVLEFINPGPFGLKEVSLQVIPISGRSFWPCLPL